MADNPPIVKLVDVLPDDVLALVMIQGVLAVIPRAPGDKEPK